MSSLSFTFEGVSESLPDEAATMLAGSVYGDVFHEQAKDANELVTCRRDGELVGIGLLNTSANAPELHVMVPADVRDEVAITKGIVSKTARQVELRQWWVKGDHVDAAKTAADECGYELNRVIDRLEKELGSDDGLGAVQTRPFEDSDQQSVIEVNNRAFADHPDRSSWDVDDLNRTLSSMGRRYEDLLLAPADGEPDGFCWCKRQPDGMGEIFVLAVHPRRHGTGLGASLLQAGLQHLRDVVGATRAMLYVDRSNTHATALYRKAGFVNAGAPLVCFRR